MEANALTSAYGRNNYDSWMENHKKQGNIVYDIDRGYITKKRNGIQGLQLPNESISNVDNIPQNNKTVKLDTSLVFFEFFKLLLSCDIIFVEREV